ncbi:N-acetyltransferase [Micromonospora sp. WMMD987]|uniref:N-acetyltransferase n=1 Tax=Micromonospora sp. WMMD987 TaxID=3016089 RepID=UPI00249A1102|nr:N-acetyltransferase [Micromonospora sp. WMMD987]WFE93551.1 N-acetyltransferase [Micromonospora sp. WMMD987]
MTRVVVCRASEVDLDVLSSLVAESLSVGPVGGWLVPEATERPQVLWRYARLLVSWGLRHGQVDTTGDRSVVAVWFRRVEVPVPSAGWMYDLHRTLGAYASRFALWHAYLDAVVPPVPHAYLAHLAICPGREDAVRVLLAACHRVLDIEGLPAFAECLGGRPREGVLAGCGYAPRLPIGLEPGGPALWRMWRPAPDAGRSCGGFPPRVRLRRGVTLLRGRRVSSLPGPC